MFGGPNLIRTLKTWHLPVSCQRVKQAPPSAPLNQWLWPTMPWHRVHVDFAGPFLGKVFFLAVDSYSKWLEIHMISDATTSKTITLLRQIFAQYGLPSQIVSDNGPQFTSDDFKQFMRSNGIKHILTSPYHPSSNGAIEKLVRTFKQSMKAGSSDKYPLQHRLQNFLLLYRSTPRATTNEPPAVLFLGRNLQTRLDLVKPNLEESVIVKQSMQKKQHDIHVRLRQLSVGDHVLAKQRGEWISGVVLRQLEPLTYLVDVGQGRTWRRYIDSLKRASRTRQL